MIRRPNVLLLALSWLLPSVPFAAPLHAGAQAPAPAAPAARTAPRAAAPAAAVALDAERCRALVERAFAKFAPVGLEVAVVQDGELLAEIALGHAREGVALTPRTPCNIASCTKAFTAALVAQQVARGRLRWDDRVVDHLPEFRMADPWITAHMTVRDLLSHRCGLKTFEGDLLWYGSDYTDAEVLARIERLPIVQSFRSEFGYQNLMYLTAGMLLERVTGTPWEDLVERELLQPLGMTGSRASAGRLPEDVVRAEPHIDGAAIPDHAYVACKPAASIWSSVHDLASWARLLLAGGTLGDASLLDAAALREMWHPHVTIGGGSGASPADFRSYGLGWFLYVENGQKLVEHDGGMPGFLSKVSLLPAERFGFVVLNNANDGVLNEAIKRALLAARSGGDAEAAIDRLAEVKQRMQSRDAAAVQRREAARQEGTSPSLPLAAYAGRYEDAVYGPAAVELTDGELHVTLLPSKRRLHGAMRHWHHDTFRVDFPDRFLPFALVTFALDHEGKVDAFRIDCPIADFDFGALDFHRQRDAR